MWRFFVTILAGVENFASHTHQTGGGEIFHDWRNRKPALGHHGGSVCVPAQKLDHALAAARAAHLHDVFIPKTYPAEWARDMCLFWNEQYLLHAFLMCNSEWDVTLPVCRVLGLRPDLLEAACPSPTDREGGSFWMRKRG